MKRRIADRRRKPRFEIVGDLWGSIDTTAPMPVLNIGRGGALVDSPLPLVEGSVHWVTTLVDGQPHLVQIRVRHSTPVQKPGLEGRFAIGVEFLKLSPAVEELIVQLMVAADSGLSAEA